MVELVAPHLAPWSNFYIMIGSAAASLTGLMFVVITLLQGAERLTSLPDGDTAISAFSTPTVVHFGAVLFAAAILSAPWHVLIQPAIVLAVAGAVGVTYMVRLRFLANRVESYEPDIEDRIWYTALPLFAYALLFIAGVLLVIYPVEALFVAAASTLLLIFDGIHNSWDVVTYIAMRRGEDSRQ